MNSLGDRMKRYERVSKSFLTPKMPVIIRVDGKAFHTFTKHFYKPFSSLLMGAMDDAAFRTALEMQGCKAVYVQSDEATFLLTDWENNETQGWFNYNHQKIISLSAAYMSVFFNDAIEEWFEYINKPCTVRSAVFDSRAFNVPREDVVNCFLWRMKDWHRNSIQMYARSVFSHKELHEKKLEDIHDMLHERGKNWATDLTFREKNGSLFTRLNTGGFAYHVEFLDGKPTYDTVNDILKDYLEY
jgi:tRNA(His) 5'-end guanylyltransferase